jgi:hypothetical protein
LQKRSADFKRAEPPRIQDLHLNQRCTQLLRIVVENEAQLFPQQNVEMNIAPEGARNWQGS